MSEVDTESCHKAFTIDLLNDAKVIPRYVPNFLRCRSCWKILSGKWKLESNKSIMYIRESRPKLVENLAIIGSSKWNDFTFRASLKFLSDSLNPPEGGAILYFLLNNLRNHYSFHFCLFKQKIEFIKRVRGIWSIQAENDYQFEIQKDYGITIRTHSGIHQCQIDETNYIEIEDKNISRGCIGIGAKYCDVEFSRILLSFH